MKQKGRLWKFRWWIGAVVVVLAAVLVFLGVFADRIIEPVLKDRLHTLIIKGSDSLYTYTLGDLNTNVLDGHAEIIDLEVRVDSARFRQLKAAHALPSVTAEVQVTRGYINGLGLLPLLFSKRLALHEFVSHDANVRFIRHIDQTSADPHNDVPLWKALRPALSRVTVDRVNLDGVKLLYRYADTSESMKLQFDTCYAEFRHIRIDSAATADTDRIFFARDVEMRFRDLKFRSPDSVNKLKAEQIVYSSRRRTLEVQDFKIQPTRKDPGEFYAWIRRQKVMNTITFKRAVFSGLRLDRYLHNETIEADSLYLEGLESALFLDKTVPLDLKSKIGQYPHQVLLRAGRQVVIPKVVVRDAALVYTERGALTGERGVLALKGVSGVMTNVTNDPDRIKKNNRMEARMQGTILGSSPVAIHLTFFLDDSTNGSFAANGRVQNVTAAQLNGLAGALASTRLQSFDMHQLDFNMTGDDFTGRGSVRMHYNNLAVVLQKVDEETGATSERKFLTRLLNRYVLLPSNPANGVERTARGVVYNRLTSQSFFGLIWKTIFTGMQDIMMRTPPPTATAARRTVP